MIQSKIRIKTKNQSYNVIVGNNLIKEHSKKIAGPGKINQGRTNQEPGKMDNPGKTFYCIFILGMKPRVKSWWNSFLRFQDIIVFVFLANFTINYFSFNYILPPTIDSPTSNYMYLLALPLADNPLVIGNWPSYLLVLLFSVFVHTYIIYLPFKIKNYLK